jgi:hypothetical protein
MPSWNPLLHSLQWVLIGLGIVGLPIPLLVASERVELDPNCLQINRDSDQPKMLTITTVQPRVMKFAHYWQSGICMSGISLGLLGWICGAGTMKSRFGCFGVGLASIVAGCAGTLSNLAPWQYGPAILGDGQKSFYVMESSFLQGQTLVLARLENENWLRRTSKVLVETNGDNTRSWQSMIRPETDDDVGVHTAQISPNGVLFGFRVENRCFFAYDLVADFRYGRNRIRDVSPFALLGPKAVPHGPDVARLEQIVRESISIQSGVPRKEQLENGLNHPNAVVAALAKKLLEVRKE